MRELMPDFRCITYGDGTFVEVPRHWADMVDPRIIEDLELLIHDHGKPAMVYAEGVAEVFEDHHLKFEGYLIPIREWDKLFREEETQ